MRAITVKVIVAAILAVAVITVATALLQIFAKRASAYVAIKACKLLGVLKYYTDIKARIAEHVFPIPIFTTSYTCKFETVLGSVHWIDGIIQDIRRNIDLGAGYVELEEDFVKVLEACKERLLNEEYKDETVKNTCKKLIVYFTIAKEIIDVWNSFSQLDATANDIICLKIPIQMSIDEDSLNVAINVLLGDPEVTLTNLKSNKGLYFENSKYDTIYKNVDSITNLLNLLATAFKYEKDMDASEAAFNAQEYIYKNIDKVTVVAIKHPDGVDDTIWVRPSNILTITENKNRICLSWKEKTGPFDFIWNRDHKRAIWVELKD